MTRSELVDALAHRKGLPRPHAERVVDALFDGMREALLRGDRVELRGFGSFKIRAYPAYTGRDPRTGEEIAVPAKLLPVFKVGKELRTRINGGVDPEA